LRSLSLRLSAEFEIWPKAAAEFLQRSTNFSGKVFRQNLSCASAAGGVISTANDLVAWMQALVGGKMLNAEYQRPVDRKERLSCPPEIVSRPIDALSPQPWKVVD
jgi:CubicO group peptidase (beta-lactamase class C family)